MFPPAALPGAVLLLAALAVAEQRVLGHPVSAGSLYNSAALQGHCITHLTECRGGTVRLPSHGQDTEVIGLPPAEPEPGSRQLTPAEHIPTGHLDTNQPILNYLSEQ